MIKTDVKIKMERFIVFLFYTYLTGVLALGRPFALINLQIFGIPIFITEIILGLCIVLAIFNTRIFFKEKLSKAFLMALAVYFLFGLLNLATGIRNRNILAMKDIVYCVYVLFMPVAFVVCAKKERIILFISTIIASNILGLIVSRFVFLNVSINTFLGNFNSNCRLFNFAISFGISLAFIIPFINILKNRFAKAALILIVAADLYMIWAMAVRSIWVSSILLLVFLALVLRMKFLRQIIVAAPIIITVFIYLYYMDFLFIQAQRKQVIYNNIMSVKLLADDFLTSLSANIQKATKGVQDKYRVMQANTHNIKANTSQTFSSPVPDNKAISNDKNIASQTFSSPVPDNKAISNDKNIASQTFSSPVPDNKAISEKLIYKINRYFEVMKLRVDKKCNSKGLLDNLFWRLHVWIQAIDSGVARPFFGVGFGIYPEYNIWGKKYLSANVKSLLDSGVVPVHNHLISIFLKMGLFGLILFLFINIYILSFGFSYLKHCRSEFIRAMLIGCLEGLIFWHSAALYFNVIDSPVMSSLPWIISGLIFSCIFVDKNITKAKNG